MMKSMAVIIKRSMGSKSETVLIDYFKGSV